MVAEIAAASDQQDQGITQVNKAVEQLNQLTQQNAANAEESASAAEEMSSQSEEMRSMVAGFKLTASGDFVKTLGAGSQPGQTMQNLPAGKKGGKAISGLHPDPRKVIPLDEKDHEYITKVLMRPKFQKRSILKFVCRIISREAEDIIPRPLVLELASSPICQSGLIPGGHTL